MAVKKRLSIIDCSTHYHNLYSRGEGRDLDIWQLIEHVVERSNREGRTEIVVEPHLPVRRAGDLPSLDETDGIIIPGSVYNTDEASIEEHGWLRELLEFIREAHGQGKPILGLCFGHQAIGAAFGVPSVRLDADIGMEVGFHPVELTAQGSSDRLFGGMEQSLMGLFFHSFHLPSLPEGSVLLARNRNCPVQSFRIGASTWGVQFHPDLDVEDVRVLAAFKEDSVRKAIGERQIDLGQDPSANRRVLENFLEIVQSS